MKQTNIDRTESRDQEEREEGDEQEDEEEQEDGEEDRVPYLKNACCEDY